MTCSSCLRAWKPLGWSSLKLYQRESLCVARNAYAMPEIITPGVSGALIERDDPNELAAAIAGVLADDDIYKQCAARAPQMASYFSWQRAAREAVDLVAKTIR